MAVTLVVSTPGAEAQSITLDQPRIVLGRGAAADLRLPSRGVSTQHAVIHVEGSEAWVLDEGSTNGTRVNGAVVPRGRKKSLRDGDTLGLGGYEVRVGISTVLADPPERTATLARRLLLGALSSVGGTTAPPCLVLTTSRRAGQTWELPVGRVVLGRGDGCEVVLDDPDCSRQHAEVARDADGATLRDLGSRNGIFVAGRRQTERRLRHGDEITIGRTTVRFEDPTDELLRAFDGGSDETVAVTGPATVSSPGTDVPTGVSIPPAAQPVEPPSVPSVPGASPGAVTAPVPRTDEARSRRAMGAGHGGRAVDWIVVGLAVVILAISVAALLLVLRSGPGH